MPEWLCNTFEYLLDFSNVLNASIAASWLILVVIGLRLLLRKSPKWVNVTLWGIVAVRLLIPFHLESAFSLIPSVETVTSELLQAGPVPGAKPAYLELISNPTFGSTVTVELGTTISGFQWDLMSLTFVWLAGIVLMAVYTGISYLLLLKRIDTAVIFRDNIFQCETVNSPFVLGILKPRIYLPFTMDAQNLTHVLAHEQAHIARKDHWWKPLGFLLLTIHWFNPFMWFAYILLCRDIELACDEKVIAELENTQRADYTRALVSCSVNRLHVAACPLAFGEVGVKERVRNVLKYQRPSFWVILLSIIISVSVAVCFLTNPPSNRFAQAQIINQSVTQSDMTVTVLEATHCENMIRVVAEIAFPSDDDSSLTQPSEVTLRSGDEIIKCKSFSSTELSKTDESSHIIQYTFHFKPNEDMSLSKELTLSISAFTDHAGKSKYELETPIEFTWKAKKFSESRTYTYEAETCKVSVDISSIAMHVKIFQTEKQYESMDHVLSLLKISDHKGEPISISGSSGGGSGGNYFDFSVYFFDSIDISDIAKVQLGNITLE